MRLCRSLLCRVCRDDSARGFGLHLRLRDARGVVRLDHRMGPDVEYAMGASTVSSGWSNTFVEFLAIFHLKFPLLGVRPLDGVEEGV